MSQSVKFFMHPAEGPTIEVSGYTGGGVHSPSAGQKRTVYAALTPTELLALINEAHAFLRDVAPNGIHASRDDQVPF